jgi:serine/threonine-protein kinase
MSSPSLFVDTDMFLFPVRIGDVIDEKYKVTRLIASGGMGVVFEGVHLLLETCVAIKVARPELVTREGLDRFLQEGRVAARLRSPHVARVLDTGRLEGGIPYLVLERLEGEDLYEALRTFGPLPVERVVDYVLQVCEGLAEAHAAGLVHRDLKPENLFLTYAPDGEEVVKILDFGITKLPPELAGRSHTGNGRSMGSPHYMAPEQMCAPHAVDARADIWTLGVVMYELISGRQPFDADTVPAVCALVLSSQQAPLSSVCPGIPEALEAAISRCLAKDPRERQDNVLELARDIAPFGSPGSEARLERIRRIFGFDFPPIELERVSDAPVNLTRRKSIAPSSYKTLSIAGVALVSVAVGFATTRTVPHLLPLHARLGGDAAAAARPLAPPVYAPAAFGVATGPALAVPSIAEEPEQSPEVTPRIKAPKQRAATRVRARAVRTHQDRAAAAASWTPYDE